MDVWDNFWGANPSNDRLETPISYANWYWHTEWNTTDSSCFVCSLHSNYYFSYINILRKICRHHASVAPSLQTSQEGQLRAHVMEIKITRKLSGVVISLFSCYVLAVAMACFYRFTGNRFPSLLFTGAMLRYLSSALNPLIYGFSSKVIKNELIKILRCNS